MNTGDKGTAAGPNPSARPIRVYVMDLLSVVPYYTGHLCARLQELVSVEVTLGSITYSHDRNFFDRIGVDADRHLLDLASRFPDAITPVRRVFKGLEYLLNLLLLLPRLLWRKVDALHVQFLPLASRRYSPEHAFLRIARMCGVRIIYTVHNVLPHEAGPHDKRAFGRIYQSADRLICHSAHAKSRLIAEFGCSPQQITVIPHGPLFAGPGNVGSTEARHALGLPLEGCILLFQGIIRPYKGVDFLLQAWKSAMEKGLRGTLVIAGTGEDALLTHIRNEISNSGLASTVRLLLRFVTVEELDHLYQAADVLLYPYSAVTTSGALLTGIGHRKAIVATALPAFEELLRDDQNALLVIYGDVEALARAMVRLASDGKLRAKLSEHTLPSSTAVPGWDAIALKTVECYQSVLATPIHNQPLLHHCQSASREN